MKQGTSALILLFTFALMVQGAGAASMPGIEMNGNVIDGGTFSASYFSGDGSLLTNLTPANISWGTANYVDPTWITSLSGVKLTTGSVSADKIAFLGKVAIVATSGGNYHDPYTAMANYAEWCGTPSATNPCLLKIMPGVYTVSSPVVMQPYIDIEGSGEKVTKITGAFSSSLFPPAATLYGASNAELRFLTTENTGTGTDITAAISNYSQSPSMLHVTATASGGTAFNFGVFNSSSSTTMTNATATASGGGMGAFGVFNDSSSTTMTNVTATASGGNSYGVGNQVGASVKINHSVITGAKFSIYNLSSTTYVSNTQINGVVYNGGTIACVGAYNASYVALSITCQ